MNSKSVPSTDSAESLLREIYEYGLNQHMYGRIKALLYAAPQECVPVMGAVGNSSSPPCETDVKPAVAALGKRIDEEPITHGTPSPTEVHPPVLEPITQTWAGKEPSAAAIALFAYLENRPSTDCEWTKGYNEAKRRTLVLLKAAGVERDMSGFTCKGCGHIRGLTNNCLNCGTPMEGPTFVYTPPKRKGEGTEQCTCGKYPHTKDCGSGDAER